MSALNTRPIAVLLIGLGVVSCSKDTTGPPHTGLGPATGHWTADGPDFIATLDLRDTILDATGRGSVQGSGTFAGPGISGGGGTFAVSGTDSSNNVQLTFSDSAHAPAFFRGRIVADTVMVGNVDGSGFNLLPLTFSHHPVVVFITIAVDSTVPGHSVQLSDSAFDLLRRPIPPPPVTWSTSDTTLAKVSATGLLTGIAPGVVTVRATHDTVVGATPVTVLQPVASVTPVPSPLSLVTPASVPLSAILRDGTGNLITGRAVSWASLNSTVARVNPDNSVQAQALGATDIRGTVVLDGRSALLHVTVRTVQPTTLAGGDTHTCGIDADGSVACWGNGLVGQLGSGFRTNVLAPVFISSGLRFKALAAGFVHTCGLAVDSTAYCWGGDAVGQLGDDGAITDTVPVAVTGGHKFVALTIGYQHTCGVVAGGAAYCWGSNSAGELGNGTTSQNPNPAPVPVSGGLSFTSLAAGDAHTCGLASDSTAYCWGGNDFGSLGDSSTTSRAVPGPVAGGRKFASIGASRYHTCAITGTGDAYCWGNNISGELGDSSGNVMQVIPVAVHAGGVRFTAIVAGYNHTCARATTSDLYCWGGNDNGQVGPNGGAATVVPVPVPVGLSGSAIVAGGFHTCAITASGAFCWGYNQLGQLGSGSASQQSATPLKVSGQP